MLNQGPKELQHTYVGIKDRYDHVHTSSSLTKKRDAPENREPTRIQRNISIDLGQVKVMTGYTSSRREEGKGRREEGKKGKGGNRGIKRPGNGSEAK